MTDSAPDADSPAPRRRGLWAVMGQPASPDEAVAVEVPVEKEAQRERPVAPVDDSPPAELPVAQPPVEDKSSEEATPIATTVGRRGLWSVMGQATAEPRMESVAPTSAVLPAAVEDNADATQSDEPLTPVAAPRGLFSVMQRAANVEAQPDVDDLAASGSSTPHSAPRTPYSEESPLTLTLSPQSRGEGTRETRASEEGTGAARTNDEGTGEEERTGEEAAERLVPQLSLGLIDPDDLEPPRYLRDAARAVRRSWIGLACGLAALAAAALTMLPQVWIGFPATAFGFAAIIVGYLTLTGAAAREMPNSTRAASIGGMLLGTIGIFLGPLFFTGLGRDLREATGQQATGKHLLELGVGLNRHHEQHAAFPVGGVFTRDAAGVVKGQHGWMTFLLPFIGEQELFRSIDQDKSYDDPANRPAMTRDVTAYFAAGGDRAKIVQGYAVSHFAGVGGEIDDAQGLAHVGIFQRDEAVQRDEVTDGLSNTLIVGELPGSFPPWGDPENWRMIGRGINKDANGFGNATRTGATFLLADGTVKFFSNKTDPKLLRKLGTRDGGE